MSSVNKIEQIISTNSIPFGKYCLKSPLAFLFCPLFQEWYGLAKYVSHPSVSAMSICFANSLPLSNVIVLTNLLKGSSSSIIEPFVSNANLPI